MQTQDPAAQMTGARDFSASLGQLVALLERGEREMIVVNRGPGSGLWYVDGELNWTDVMAGPCEFLLLYITLLCVFFL